jgi:hypothetical protein
MTWAQRLKRVFGVDVENCMRCRKALKVIAYIEEPVCARESTFGDLPGARK